ncbi:flavin reductase domain protein FMN-binding [Pseudarthrobacter chlorophenolicus A6]|uniref:Flavin reductase domain protein FMN-binding n=1 Tax=Pseudarthrobacter chlorophenolicus (strain ATCC 700700 / DSM 12829 / CIP 107037 / JCM 12360 / KCTC 9906 / NCIMB 13794 / A6) TaxID=452863 RepID=B8H6G7_PSECP|nr:flavin reductase family protein [Pseudarthrobacter chlorophenolicus]ACL41493.1 flavin reductase domain protein FMN-binding [Pseudarthrobacter chlorophenolicus A6]SDQ63207.1 NADH-FMN oxidoreductase RutF, flavin reductase (DIM6/NTAB) family [Pseudarthrobacter chlorophenolicus]
MTQSIRASTTETQDTSPENAAWFRYVLGQYPTGVTLITAATDDDEPVGMVVGTFSSVSLDPALVAFMPDVRSTSWPKIRDTGSFCANVLTAGQQDVCRAFSRKAEDRFTANQWGDTPSGSPRLEGAAAWIDCDIEDVIRSGDHDIVIGRVKALGVGSSRELPLLFLRGGYGSFTIPSIISPATALTRHVKAADAARPVIEALADALKLEVLVSGVVDDSVVVLTAAGVDSSPGGSPSRVGVSFGLAAPLAPLYVAWAGEAAEKRWIDNARVVVGEVDATLAHAELEQVRSLGYAVSVDVGAAAEFERIVYVPSDTAAPDLSGVLPLLIERAASSGPAALDDPAGVTSLHAPVFDSEGQVAVTLTLNGFPGNESLTRLEECRDSLLGAARSITDAIGGNPPPQTP